MKTHIRTIGMAILLLIEVPWAHAAQSTNFQMDLSGGLWGNTVMESASFSIEPTDSEDAVTTSSTASSEENSGSNPQGGGRGERVEQAAAITGTSSATTATSSIASRIPATTNPPVHRAPSPATAATFSARTHTMPFKLPSDYYTQSATENTLSFFDIVDRLSSSPSGLTASVLSSAAVPTDVRVYWLMALNFLLFAVAFRIFRLYRKSSYLLLPMYEPLIGHELSTSHIRYA